MKEEESIEIRMVEKDRQRLRIHAIYLAIIFVLLAVFLFLLAPMTVCQRAFENFSFASTIVSIVLAVVSIVYSFRSQSNASENVVGIREIERSISSRLEKFDSMKNELVEEVRGITRPIGEEVSSIRLGQVETSSKMEQMLEKMSQKAEIKHNTGDHLLNRTSFYGNALMYTLCKASKASKDIDFSKFGPELSNNFDYFWGFVIALGALNSDVLVCEVSGNVMKVTKYDEEQLGDESYWRSFVLTFKNKKDSQQLLDEIDLYFADESSKVDGE